MNSEKKSLYKIISSMIVLIVVLTMVAFSFYNYNMIRANMVSDLKYKTNSATNQLKNSISHFIESYSISEYENILTSYMQAYRGIYGFVIEDSKMAQILGNSKYYVVKMRDKDWNIVSYKTDGKEGLNIEKIFYKRSEDIYGSNGDLIGKITMYTSDRFIKEQLNSIVISSIAATLAISLILSLFLYFIMKIFIFRPMENIVNTIEKKDKNGIPLSFVPPQNTLEIFKLSTTLNEMISSIRKSRQELENLNSELEVSKDKYQKLMNLASDMVFIIDLEGNLIEYSDQTQRQLGYTKEEMKNLKLSDWHRDLKEKNIKKELEQFSSKPKIYETIHTRKDGSTYYAEVLSSRIEIENREYLYASVRDISQRKENERIIKEQKEEFETIFNYSQDGIAIMDLDSNFLNFNDAYMKMTGFTKEELLNSSCINLTVTEDRKRTKKALEEVLEKGFINNFEKSCQIKNDKRISVNISVSLLPDRKRFLMLVKDMSSIKIMQEQARLASMGEMIGNIAHQWRQPLSVITSNASALKLKLEMGILEDDDILKSSDDVIMQANYLSKTIDNFRDFIKGKKEYGVISVVDTVKSTLNLLEASLNNNYIKVVADFKDDLKILGNKNELSEAIINIVNNSKDILKAEVDDDNRYVLINTNLLNSNTLELKIIDSGGGIDEDIVDRIFEPYFTTKHQSKGTGLGLSIAEKIIRERHGGLISVYNQDYEIDNKKLKGACFSIVFKDQGEKKD